MIFNSTKFNIHWSEKSLSNLGTFKRGKSKHRPRNDSKLFKNGTYPLIQTGDIKSAHLYINSHNTAYNEFGLAQSKIWPKNTLCITIAANIAETGILEYPMCFPDSVVGFTADQNKTSELFMHYVFSYIRNTIQKTASGSTQDNINIEFLTNLLFKIPVKKTQDSICNVLENIDKKIELNNKINIELEAMAMVIYDYWFEQFDFPDENGKPYKSSGGKMVYDEDLKKKIPYSWSVRNISDTMQISSGYPFKSDSYIDSGAYKIVTIKNVQDNKLTLHNTDFVNNIPSDIDSSCILELQDILISLTGNVGRICLVDQQNLLLNQRVGKLQTEPLHKNYFYLTYRSPEFRFWLERISVGTSQKNLSPIDAVNRLHAFPDPSILGDFDQLVSPMIKKIFLNLQENKKLESLRDWLLPMLMNGQVTVSEAS